MSGTKRKKTHIPSDFKHRKAKVGKRAPQQLNLTDTSFKAVAVKLQDQSIAAAGGGSLVSARGKSITELTNQLHHPAGAVRVSAIRGLTSVIQATPFDVLETHLSTLLPVISKCGCVDEEDHVRSLGLNALRELIRHEGDLWKPFIPLLSAFVTSALNSLDRSTRLDGSRAVEIISSLPLGRKTVATILPAYITLLQDHSRHAAENKPEGKKKKKKNDDNKRLVVLQSLVALLRSIDTGDEESAGVDSLEPDLAISCGGLSTSSLLLNASGASHPVNAVLSIEKFTNQISGFEEGSKKQGKELKQSNVSDIFSKLRDVFLEVSQRGSQGGELLLSVADMEELSLLVSSIHLLWKLFSKKEKSPAMTHLVNLMSEAIPVRSRSQDQIARFEALNGNLCFAVIEMEADVLKDSKSMKTVLDYLLPRLDAQNLNQSLITMNVFWGLLHLRHEEDGFAVSKKTREEVLQQVSNVYFSDVDVDVEVAQSAGCRKAVKLAVSLLKASEYGIASDSAKQMIVCFPKYLAAWKGNFLRESDEVVETLHHVLRRTDLAGDGLKEFANALREGLDLLFLSKLKNDTTFEQYPMPLQRKLLCFVVALGAPGENLLKGLGRICSRAGNGTSNDLVDYVVGIMHEARRTVSMKAYLGFVMACVGVPKSSPPPSEGDVSWVKSRDKATLRAARALRRCGTDKVVPMVAPMILSWLDISGQESLVRFRCALQLIAVSAQEFPIFEIVPKLRSSLLGSLFDFFNLCMWENERSDLFTAYDKALTALFEACPLFLKELAEETAQRLKDNNTVDRCVNALHELSRKSSLANGIRLHAASWMEAAKEITLSLAERPSIKQAELMSTNLQLVVGQIE